MEDGRMQGRRSEAIEGCRDREGDGSDMELVMSLSRGESMTRSDGEAQLRSPLSSAECAHRYSMCSYPDDKYGMGK